MVTNKSIRADINLGDITLDVFKKPEGSYFFSASQLAKILGLNGKTFLLNYVSKDLKSFLNDKPGFKGFCEKLPIDGNSVSVTVIPLELVSYIFYYYDKKGNLIAHALLMASFAEALERRADAAFGIHHTEQERNVRISDRVRMEGKITRCKWTDAIHYYITTHDVSEKYRRFVCSDVTNAVNVAVLGKTAAQLRHELQIPKNKSPRDYMTEEQLKKIEAIESYALFRVDHDGICPKQAITEAIASFG